ncbi:Wd40 containing snare-dependent exocytosis protein [Mycena kentingensis (nom. inval.)]|nr:Wd40 containing snare-dependent exocytosis protein [Mycena kentingensis (nom. inval.)]
MSWPTTNDDPATTLLRNKLAAKALLRRAEQLDEPKNTLNQTLHKLNQEVANGLNLESTLAKCRGDLSSEQLVSQNSRATVLAMQEKLKEQGLEIRGLELNLESMSHNSNNSNARTSKLEKEKSTLETRVRELEGNLRELSSPAPSTTATPSRSRAASRRRSSSVSDTREAALEQDLRDTRASLAQKDAELQTASTKLSDPNRSSLQEKEEDLELLRQQQLDGSREDELLKRIDEDEAKIAALQRLSAEVPKLKERVRQLEQQLLIESERVMEMDRRNIKPVREKEEALDEVDDSRAQVTQLMEAVKERDTYIAKQRQTQPNASEADVERLLVAIERIRGERDNLA